MSSMTPKVVLFEMAIEEDQLKVNETDDGKLELQPLFSHRGAQKACNNG